MYTESTCHPRKIDWMRDITSSSKAFMDSRNKGTYTCFANLEVLQLTSRHIPSYFHVLDLPVRPRPGSILSIRRRLVCRPAVKPPNMPALGSNLLVGATARQAGGIAQYFSSPGG
ncbi:hypothetical protein TWF569_003218 [Orbilia oligospora]|nr:hypothetical protein TWF569_003218 [Orbilia oligospora]